MNGGVYIGLDLGVKVNNAGGVEANVVVVQDTNAYEGKLPTAANADKVLGVTLDTTSDTGRTTNVRKGGIAPVKAASAITAGDRVNVADVQGRVKTVSEGAGTKVYVVGVAQTTVANADELVEVLLTPGAVYTV